MQQDLAYPTKRKDMTLLHKSLQRFEKAIQHTMAVMKEIRDALEEVSVAFHGLTFLSFCGDGTKAMMQRFVAEMRELKDGPLFLQYNKCVHEGVVKPVKQLRVWLTAAEFRARQRDDALKKYESLRREVAAKERRCAKRYKCLTESKTYQKKVNLCEEKLKSYEAKTTAFTQSFERLMLQTATVTEVTMRRYVQLNAAFLLAVVYAVYGVATPAEFQLASQLPSVPSATHVAAAGGVTAPAERATSARSSALPAAGRVVFAPALVGHFHHCGGSMDGTTAASQQLRQDVPLQCSEHSLFFRASSACAAPRYLDVSRSGSLPQFPGVDETHGAMGHCSVDLSRSSRHAFDNEASVNGAEDGEAMRPMLYNIDLLRMERGTPNDVSGLPIPLVWRTQDLFGPIQDTPAFDVRDDA
ncbi:hypothetical protein TraAM80_03124 [Trypanosoma rangeli]|uniref:BAR domain-containing protein n=1 Tax=Trypanosoma rangeli TaxID=5698 RepID=A0A422NQZ1_TRYRA|nr:uncharacterized protein TraAM80_03124 [Trypanosoma rangeli]RNF07866.1 hypothetical protein TraAM80_03124 [Trypanosoma rangeli]|eukprot:RNF07866.1 hypothetical protein TraAM80_03124 [Trypanosoma rangeli]